MLHIDKAGWVLDPRVKHEAAPLLVHGKITHVAGIIVHETDSKTAQATLNGYKHPKADGAHFLIDKDGTIMQTASIHSLVWHVGKLKARCLLEKTCPSTEVAALQTMKPHNVNHHEMAKKIPKRFPYNGDAIGIEMVGAAIGPGKEPPYEAMTPKQNASLHWLVTELEDNLKVPTTEIFRHPTVSHKNSHEAETAIW